MTVPEDHEWNEDYRLVSVLLEKVTDLIATADRAEILEGLCQSLVEARTHSLGLGLDRSGQRTGSRPADLCWSGSGIRPNPQHPKNLAYPKKAPPLVPRHKGEASITSRQELSSGHRSHSPQTKQSFSQHDNSRSH